MRLPLSLHEIATSPWAIAPATLAAIVAQAIDDEAQASRAGQAHEPKALAPTSIARRVGNVEVVSVEGIVVRGARSDSEWWFVGMDDIANQVRRAAADPNVAATVLAIDSPGGVAAGLPELAESLRESASRKPLLAVATPSAFSAAYWIGSQASEFFVQPSGMVGSVGVVGTHMDISGRLEQLGVKITHVHAGRYKVEGNPYQPLDDEARAQIQERVDVIHESFLRDVAKGRRVTPDHARTQFGEGRIFTSQRAVERGMVDGVATLEQVVARAGKQAATLSGSRSQVAHSLNAIAEQIRGTHGGGR